MESSRVVITGISCISTLGISKDEIVTNLITKKTNLINDPANNIKNLGYCDRNHINIRKNTEVGPSASIISYLIREALKDSKLTDNLLQKDAPVDLLIGSSFGNKPDCYNMHSAMRESEESKNKPNLNAITEGLEELFNMYFNEDQLSTSLNNEFPFEIKTYNLQAQCISSIMALLYGANLIRTGQTDYVLISAYDLVDLMPYYNMLEHKLIGSTFCMPYNKSNDGTSYADGGGVFVLENYEHAKKRNVKNFYGEIKGGYITSKPDGIVGPTVKSIISTIDETLKLCNLKVEDIGLISPHGMGNNELDNKELFALKQYFKDHINQIPIVTYVANLGYSLAGSGLLDLIIAMDCMKNSRVIGTISPDNPHEEFNYNYGYGENFNHKVKNILKIKTNVAGEVACLIVSDIN